MKSTMIAILFSFMALFSTGQEQIKTKMLRSVEVTPPVFTGVKTTVPNADEAPSINDYLAKKVLYPKESEKTWKEGTMIVQFTVLTNGKLGNFQIINSISTDIDREVIRTLKSTNKMWIPGHNNGNPVDMEKEVAITFQMEKSDHVQLAQRYFKKAEKKLLKNKYNRALQLYDNAMVYQPYSEAILFKRGVTRLMAGNMDGACKDLNRLKSLGSDIADEYLKQHCDLIELAVKDK